MTTNRIRRHCADFAALCITDHEVSYNYRDTVIKIFDSIPIAVEIKVPIPIDSVIVRDSVRVINGRAYMPPIHKQQGIIAMDIFVKNSRLDGKAYLTDSTIHYIYRDTIPFEDSLRIANAVKETLIKDTVTLPPERYVPKFYKRLLWVDIILIVAGILYLLVRLKYVKIDKIKQLFEKE